MRAILKQTSWLFFAQSLSRTVAFFYTIFLARTLGVSDFGLLSVALAYFSILSSITDFGLNRFLIREVARDKLSASNLFWDVSFLRLLLTSVFFAIFAFILYWLDSDKMRVSLILLATVAILPQSIAMCLDAIFVALQNLKYSAISIFISSLATAFTGLFLISSGSGSFGAVIALIIGQIVYALVTLFFLSRQKVLKFSRVRSSNLKKALIGSLPYGLLGMLGLIYFRIDTILLSYLRGSFETGIYAAAYRFLEAASFIPAAFQAALFPVFVKSFGGDQNEQVLFRSAQNEQVLFRSAQNRKLFSKSLKILGVLGFTIMLGYIFILPPIIEFFLPNYLQSIGVITILALAIPFMFMNVAAVSLLLSTDKFLKEVIILSVLTVSFNIITNLIFIPIWGFMAAAWITVLSEISSFIIFYLFTRYKILGKQN